MIGLEKGHGRLVGIDLLETAPLQGADILLGDINDDAMLDEMIRLMNGKADIVMSDMAADTTGHRPTDHLRTTALLELALDMALRILNPGGSFLAKCFRGGTEKEALDLMRRTLKPSNTSNLPPAVRNPLKVMCLRSASAVRMKMLNG